AYRMTRDMLQLAVNEAAKVQNMIDKNKSTGQPGSNNNTQSTSSTTCQLSLLSNLPPSVTKMIQHATVLLEEMDEQYKDEMLQMQQNMSIANFSAKFADQVLPRIANMFNRGTAMRANG